MDTCGELSPDFGFKNPLFACYVAAGLYGALVCLLMHFLLQFSFVADQVDAITFYHILKLICHMW